MKVALTGASGFIGRYVLAELAKHPVEVVAAVRRLPVDLPELQQAQLVELDLCDASTDAFDLMGAPDVLIHLAWDGLPNYESLHHFGQHLPAQYRFLSQLVHSGLESMLVTGTCFEYGLQSGPLSESMETRPSNPYGLAKDTLRRQLEFLQAVHPFSLTWARLFYLYGERQAKSSLFPQIQGAVQRGEKIFNMSGGEQLRDYLPISQVATYLVALALGRLDFGVINVCSGRPISVRKLVENWIAEYGWSIDLNFGHYPYSEFEPLAFWGTRDKLDRSMVSG